MAENPYPEGTKYHYLFDVFSQPEIPDYAELLAATNKAFPHRRTTIGALKRFKSAMRSDGHVVGEQKVRLPGADVVVPTPKQAERALSKLKTDDDRREYVADLVELIGYKGVAEWLRA